MKRSQRGLPCTLSLASFPEPSGPPACLVRFTSGPPLRTRSKRAHTDTETDRIPTARAAVYYISKVGNQCYSLYGTDTRNALINTSGVFSWRPTHYRLLGVALHFFLIKNKLKYKLSFDIVDTIKN